MEPLHLGIDLGTSGLKVAAVNGAGRVLVEAEQSYAIDRPSPDRAEIDPRVWVQALSSAVAALGDVSFVSAGIAGQMHGLVLVDARGEACRPAMLWPDRRAQAQLSRWQDLGPDASRRLANPLVAGMAGPMLAWVLDNEPEVLARARWAVQPKDYLRGQLGGALVTERSDASATLLWDVPADAWAFDLIDALGLPAGLLATVVPSDTAVGQARLPGGPVLVAGAGDTPAALLGSGGLSPGQVQINVGTGAQVLLGVAEPQPSSTPVTHLYADAGQAWYAMAAIQNGGLALNKVREWLGLSWPEFFERASSAQVGAGGVSVVPFLSGERGGVASPSSRGAWLGLTGATSSADLARAAVEAMLFAIRRGVQLLGTRPDVVRATGGGLRDAMVAQSLADVLRARVDVIPERSASAIGAAMLAARGVGLDLPLASPAPRVFEPRASAALEAAYELWCERLVAGEV